MMFRMRITANVPQIKENVILRKLVRSLPIFNRCSSASQSRLIHVHKKTSCSALSMLLQHVKELIEIVFQLISVTKVQHFGRALSVSVRLCPFTVTGRCHTARLCTSRLPGAAACREVLRLIWRVRHCGVTATSERFSLLRPPFRRAGL